MRTLCRAAALPWLRKRTGCCREIPPADHLKDVDHEAEMNERTRVRSERSRFGIVAVIIGIIVVLCVIVFTMTDTNAQAVPCAPRDQTIDLLKKKYGEEPVFMATDSSGNLVEIFASPQRTWTMLLTAPGRSPCVIGSGMHIEAIRPVLPG
jgi:Tfp pilus assembly protein PilN